MRLRQTDNLQPLFHPDQIVPQIRHNPSSFWDGRRGSAGFVVQSKDGEGTRLSFSFQRDVTGYGFPVIHPLGNGHALVSLHSRGVTIHRGGSWGDIGWGDPATSDKIELNADAKGRLKAKEGYVVTAIVAKHGHRLDGMRLLYMRVRDGRLNPDDSYWPRPYPKTAA